jgi:hypothetical protein
LEVVIAKMVTIPDSRGRSRRMSMPIPDGQSDDKQAIYEVVLRYCRALDRLDFELLRSCYHEDAMNHYNGFDGGREAFIAWVRALLEGFAGTMHMIGNHLVELDGDLARSEAYGIAYNLANPKNPENHNLLSGFRHVDRFERRDGEWRIAERFAVREFFSEAPELQLPPPGQGPAAQRNRSDLAYASLREGAR